MLLRLFSRRAMFSDDQIELVLSNQDVADEACGIDDGYLFSIYRAKTRDYVGYVCLRLGESPALYYLGHIGYRIEEKHRGNGWAGRACRLMRPLIERLGCVLERIADVPPEQRTICAGAPQKCRYIWRMGQNENA